jgi:hypothetical protein
MTQQHFTFSPHEDGRPIVLDGKAVAYIEADAPPFTGEILASSQDVREKLETLAVYMQQSQRLKGSPKAQRLADEALDLLARTINPNHEVGGAAS